jgi:hypothetical protein
MVTPKRVPPRPPRSDRGAGASGTSGRGAGAPVAPRQAPFPSRPRRRGSEQIIGAIALLIVGVFAGVGVVGLLASPSTPAATAAPTDAPTDDTGAIPSDGAGDTVAPVSPVLEGRLPTTVNGVTMTVQSAVDATTLSGSPDGRALNAAVVHLGKQASDLEIAVSFDDSGSLDLTILGFRADGISATDMRAAVLSAWLAADTPGVAKTALNWSGTEVTKVSYGDDGTDEYVMTIGDSVFVLETSDASLAQTGVALLVGAPLPSGSLAPATSPSPAGSGGTPASAGPSPTS